MLNSIHYVADLQYARKASRNHDIAEIQSLFSTQMEIMCIASILPILMKNFKEFYRKELCGYY